MPKKILILSSGNPCRNPRPVKEATSLGAAGYDVTLLTLAGPPDLDAVDFAMTRGAPYRHVVAETAAGKALDGYWKGRQWLGRKFAARGMQTPYSLGKVGALERAARRIPFDLAIAHNEASFYVGSRLINSGRAVAADFEDWHSEDLLPSARAQRPLRLLRELEKKMLHQGRYVTTTSQAMSHGLTERYGGQAPVPIANAFPLQPVFRRQATSKVPAFFWFSQTLGPGRGLEKFRDVWVQCRTESRLVLIGNSYGGYRDNLLASLPEAFRPRVRFLPLVPPAELPSLIAEHDVGLALEEAEVPNRDLTITNKILQYMNAGLAILASDTAGQREALARAPGSGLVATAFDGGLARDLDAILSDPPRLEAMCTASRKGAETVYCWEREEPKLLDLVGRALASS